MPNWKDILDELKAAGSNFDIIRRKYLSHLFNHTGRNIIIYYSGWLQKGRQPYAPTIDFSINDSDKNGFMACIHKMDKSKGLDLILHTPGGSTAATESLVQYLRSMFGTNIRAIIPQISMSAGTMVALSCKSIVMGEHSNLGPIDPQFNGLPAHGIIAEFDEACNQAVANPNTIPIYQPIIAKYNPTLIGECRKAIDWSKQIVKDWLISGMFVGEQDAEQKAEKIIGDLGDPQLTKSHSRHISKEMAIQSGIKVESLEDDNELQERVLSVHHICIQTLAETPAYKIIENHTKTAYIETAHGEIIMAPRR